MADSEEPLEGLYQAKLRDTGINYSEDDYKRFCEKVGQQFNFGVLDLSGERIGINVLTKLTKVLRSNPRIKVFNFYGNLIRDHGIHSLLQLVWANPQVTALDVGCNDFTNQSAPAIIDIIRTTPILSIQLGITEVAWNTNKFTLDTMIGIIEAVKSARRIECLGLNKIALSIGQGPKHQTAANHVAEFISVDQFLRSLSIAGCNFTSKEMSTIVFEGLLQNTLIKFLDIHDSPLKEPLGSCLLSKLFQMKSLAYIDIRNCHLGPESGNALLQTLKNTRMLSCINIGGNDIGDEGMKPILQGLLENDTITEIHASKNGITSEVSQLLKEVIIQNKTLYSIDLSNNPIGDIGAEAIADGLPFNSDLEIMSINSCRISNSGAIKISEALAKNKGLKVFSMADNFLDKECGYQIIEKVKTNEVLMKIDASASQIDHFGASALKEICKRNHQIQRAVATQPLRRQLIQLSIQRTKLSEAMMRLKKLDEDRETFEKIVIDTENKIEDIQGTKDNQLKYLKKQIDGMCESVASEEKSLADLKVARESMKIEYANREAEIQRNTENDEKLFKEALQKTEEIEKTQVNPKEEEEKEALTKELEQLKAKLEELNKIKESPELIQKFVAPEGFVPTPRVFVTENEQKSSRSKKSKGRKSAREKVEAIPVANPPAEGQ